MKLRFFHLFILVFIAGKANALTVTSISHGDWDDTLTWSNHQIPVNPDSISISHYITIGRNISIQAPTVLIITQTGTVCGNYQITQLCGSLIYNYGYLFIHQMLVKDMWNYNQFYATVYVNISGCSLSGYGNGYYNVPPNAATLVWPPVNCRTSATNWQGTGLSEGSSQASFLFYPNPARQFVMIESAEKGIVKVYAGTGRLVLEQIVYPGQQQIETGQLAPGFYSLLFFGAAGVKSAKLLLQQ